MIDYTKRTLSEFSNQLKSAMKPLVEVNDYEYLVDLIDYTDIDLDPTFLNFTDLSLEVHANLSNDYGLGIPEDVCERLMEIIAQYLSTLYADRISDEMVCKAYVYYQENFAGKGSEKFPYDILHEWTGEDFQVCYESMERTCRNGFVEYGVSLRTGWITKEGKELIDV
jgi:hypothetical protein